MYIHHKNYILKIRALKSEVHIVKTANSLKYVFMFKAETAAHKPVCM